MRWGREGMCGLLTDRFGISCQIVSEIPPRLAVTTMKKLYIAALEAAFHPV